MQGESLTRSEVLEGNGRYDLCDNICWSENYDAKTSSGHTHCSLIFYTTATYNILSVVNKRLTL